MAEQAQEARPTVQETLHAIGVAGAHGSIPDYWREPMAIALASREVELDVLAQQLEQANGEIRKLSGYCDEWKLELAQAEQRIEELERALSWALDCLELALKRIDTLEPDAYNVVGLKWRLLRLVGFRVVDTETELQIHLPFWIPLRQQRYIANRIVEGVNERQRERRQ